MNRPKTIFLDIDGTLIKHHGNLIKQVKSPPTLLDGTIDKLLEWERKGYNIILTTGRKESYREKTTKMLSETAIPYDQLVMGIGGGVRVLINDKKPDNENNTAIAINLKRNDGIGKINEL
tara:strand:- start:9643 stop:10002 length:360 start_codon:yes stop_codon:yes gene_type:complete